MVIAAVNENAQSTRTNNILGVVLSGGKSTRMGQNDKAFMTYDILDVKVPMAKHAVSRLSQQGVDVIVNTNADAEIFLKKTALSNIIIADSFTGYAGPLAGVLAGLEFAQENGYQRIVTVSVDTPFFPKDLVRQLSSIDASIVISKSTTGEKGRNLQPAFGIWDVSIKDDLKVALASGTRKVMAFVEQQNWQTVEWDTQEFDCFFNVNAPQDMLVANGMFSKYESLM